MLFMTHVFTRTSFRFASFIYTMFLVVGALVLLASPIRAAERGTVCVYHKKINPNDPRGGFYVVILNEHGSSGRFQLRYVANQREVYIDNGKQLRPNGRDAATRKDLASKIGDMFSSIDAKKLSTPEQYYSLFNLVLEESRTFRPVQQMASFGIQDSIFAFDFDNAAQNIALLQDGNRPESIALYNFTLDQWTASSVPADYKERIARNDFKMFFNEKLVEASFAQKKTDYAAMQSEMMRAQQKLAGDADQKATWAILFAVLALAGAIFVLFVTTGQIRGRVDQITKIEAKVKNIEGRMNKPFYQTDQIKADDEKQNTVLIQSLMGRLAALERQNGVTAAHHEFTAKTFSNPTAARLQTIALNYRKAWSENAMLKPQHVAERLMLVIDQFLFQLQDLEEGTTTKTFILKSVIPHIDAIDSVFQPEADNALNTPTEVDAYIKELKSELKLSEIEVRPRASVFDNERHEKAGAILRTNLDAGTITKVLKRGIIHEGYVRKALVIRAE
jgi:hypothetical protein